MSEFSAARVWNAGLQLYMGKTHKACTGLRGLMQDYFLGHYVLLCCLLHTVGCSVPYIHGSHCSHSSDVASGHCCKTADRIKWVGLALHSLTYSAEPLGIMILHRPLGLHVCKLGVSHIQDFGVGLQ